MKLKLAATIATVIVIIVGFAMISPLFFRQDKVDKRVMLSFSISEPDNAAEWCRNLSSILKTHNIPATVFIVGKIAEQYPQTVTCFSDKVDIGSQTYDNLNLTGISDYSVKLQEVKKGKTAVDKAGHVYSRVFRAPYGATDQDIYSLLSRSGISADFSYKSQYNVYQNGQFIKFNAAVFDGKHYSPEFFLTRAKTSQPLIIEFDNTYSTSDIEVFLSKLITGDFEFVNASKLVGLTLTSRVS
jgi:peptidoglycan/xylan/chitin deacetylase (PgdA/CDA1 family)